MNRMNSTNYWVLKKLGSNRYSVVIVGIFIYSKIFTIKSQRYLGTAHVISIMICYSEFNFNLVICQMHYDDKPENLV